MILGEPKLIATKFQLASGQVHLLQSAAMQAVRLCPPLHEGCGLLCPWLAVHMEIAQQFLICPLFVCCCTTAVPFAPCLYVAVLFWSSGSCLTPDRILSKRLHKHSAPL